MNKIQSLEDKVRLYLTFSPENSLYLDFWYLEKLGQEYGYEEVTRELKRQKKNYI